MSDKTNFVQSLMHMIKSNLGTGILAMPITFAHTGLISAIIGMPLLCLIATYCVHLLVRSSQHLEGKMEWINLDYAELAKGSFRAGPRWMKRWSSVMCKFIDAILIINQMGICCVYVVFVVKNIQSILVSLNKDVPDPIVYMSVLPVFLLLSYIKTMKRLSYASAGANALQVVGIAIVFEYLIRSHDEQPVIENFRPISEATLGFGAAMFAFEGISVVLPIYTRMKNPEQMGGWAGLINLSYVILLILYFTVGFFGYLRFGSESKASITLNLPKEPLYDIVRAIFTASLFLTYPLQLYVPNEIVWNWLKAKFFLGGDKSSQKHAKYEYLCRTVLVLFTFLLAYSLPLLNLMMDLVGSIAGTTLSIILPPMIHLAAFWEDTTGRSKAFMLVVDLLIISIGLLASASGSYFSFIGLLQSVEG